MGFAQLHKELPQQRVTSGPTRCPGQPPQLVQTERPDLTACGTFSANARSILILSFNAVPQTLRATPRQGSLYFKVDC